MKLFFIFFLVLLFNLKCIAQTDTLEQKLIQYKKLFDAGLITEKEYQEVKAKTLEIPVTRKEEINLSKSLISREQREELGGLKRGYLNNLAAGITMLSISSVAILSTILFVSNSDKNKPLYYGAEGLVLIGSFVSISRGSSLRNQYYRRKDELGVSINQNGIGLCYTFK